VESAQGSSWTGRILSLLLNWDHSFFPLRGDGEGRGCPCLSAGISKPHVPSLPFLDCINGEWSNVDWKLPVRETKRDL
jgi:hypothetical protein